MNREAIAGALFGRLSAATGFSGTASFKTASRRFKLFSDVSPADQPALFLIQRGENVSTVPGQPSVYVLSFDVAIYAHTGGDVNVPPASIINPLLDAVTTALAPEAVSNKQTLGGLVQHAWVEGEIQTDEGLLQQQGYALVPIKVKAV